MPEMTGIEAITALRASHPGMPVVALTSFVEEDKIRAALAAGAAGYLLKDAEARRWPPRSAPRTAAACRSTRPCREFSPIGCAESRERGKSRPRGCIGTLGAT